MRLDEIGRTIVGHQHAFLNQLVSIVAHSRQYFFDLACGIADNVGFDRFKIDRSAFFACFCQHLVQPVQIQQMRHET